MNLSRISYRLYLNRIHFYSRYTLISILQILTSFSCRKKSYDSLV